MQRIRTGENWSFNEDRQLKMHFFEGKGIREIAVIHKREDDAIVFRLMKLGVLGYTEYDFPENHGMPWPQDEINRLITEFNEGVSIEILAKRHKRQKNAILCKLILLRLIDFTNRGVLAQFSDSPVLSNANKYAQLKKKILEWKALGYVVDDLLERLEDTQTKMKENHDVQESHDVEKKEKLAPPHFISKNNEFIIEFRVFSIIIIIITIIALGAYCLSSGLFITPDRTLTPDVHIVLTPDVHFVVDNAYNRLTVVSAPTELAWGNIKVYLDTGQFANVSVAGTAHSLSSMATTIKKTGDVMAGDTITITNSNPSYGDIKFSFVYVPTNSIIGTWKVTI